MAKMVQTRWPEDLIGSVDRAAKADGISRTAWLHAAAQRQLAIGGEQTEDHPAPPEVAAQRAASEPSAARYYAMLAARQQKLNEDKRRAT